MSTILKWAGNKSAVMPELAKHLPHGSRLVEPFAGSCAVMMATDYPEYLIADVNPDLINLYQKIVANPYQFLDRIHHLFNTFNSEHGYYDSRDSFNHDKGPEWRAELFLYLNRHCYRGLCRYNQKGQFNVPYGNYKKPYFPEREILDFAEKAKRATFLCAGYQDTLKQIKNGDVVYCDPPYDGTFSDYHSAGFDKDEHHDLASMLLDVSERCPVVVSNSDTLYTRSILRAFDITNISVARSVGVKAGDKKRALEIIAVRKPAISGAAA